jgi:hypothetical protein
MWHFRREFPSLRVPLVTVEERIAQFREVRRKGLIPHHRARSKKAKDASRQQLREERARLYQEAYHDSVGEVLALTVSEVLHITRAEVLRDPKLRTPGGYRHPGLKGIMSMTWDDGLPLLLSRSGRYGFFPKLPKPTPQPNCP